jgi:hypothetical protein
MGRVDKPALKGSWLGTALVVLNPIVELLLRSPVHWPLSRWFLLIAWTGQKSGLERSTPVSYVSDEVGTWVTTGDRWPDFACGNPTFRVCHRGRWRPAVAVEVADLADSQREHERIFSVHAWFRILAGIPKHNGKPDSASIARAIAAGRRLIRIEYRAA